MVSIIVPNYNHKDFLRKRLESIFNQSYQNYEVILLDDKSIDGSEQILLEYADHPKVSHCIINEKNSGSTFIQWEKGIALSNGDFIWIAESDDFCENNFLETLIPHFDDQSVGCCSCASNYVNEKDAIIGEGPVFEEKVELSKKNIIEYNFYKNNLVTNASSALIRKKAIHNLPKDYKSVKYVGDWLFWLNILKNDYKIVFDKKYLNSYRIHNDNVSSRAYKIDLSTIEGIKIFNYLKTQFFLSKKDKKIISDYWINRLLFSFFPFRPFSNYTMRKFKQLVLLSIKEPALFFLIINKRIMLVKNKRK